VRDTVLSDEREPSGETGSRVPGSKRDSADSSSRRLADAVRAAIEEVTRQTGTSQPELIVAAGMLSSEVGLLAVPHILTPAGIEELADALVLRTIPEVSAIPVYFVPGVRTPASEDPDGWMRADIMRGEECETLGAVTELTRQGLLDPDQDGQVFVWPGSHTKLVEVDRRGRIVRSQTTLAGEFLQAVARHTLVAASLPAGLPLVLDPAAVEAGARATEEQGLGRAAFLVRIAAVGGSLSAEERAAFWISAVVSDDVRSLARHSILTDARQVWVGGREPLRSLYARNLASQTLGRVSRLDDDLVEAASAMGALAVARCAIDRDR
jgi:2-dehydro-3-deoxygalactonokinase